MLNRALLLVFGGLALLLLLDALTPLEVRSLYLTSWLLTSWLWVAVALSGIGLLGRWVHRWRGRTTGLVLVLLAVPFSVLRFWCLWGGDWKVQTILYQHRELSNRTIEYQMQNPGPGGYNKRTVDKRQLLPGLDWLRAVDEKSIDAREWQRVDIELNELEIKYP
jgi:lysylphosphatidylglycerol synthetase-like protein (DUF2156 family)